MDLTVNGIANILKGSREDVMFLLLSETAEEVIDILIDNGIEFGCREERQSEASIIKVLDEEEVVMITRFNDGEFFIESAYGYQDLKSHYQDERWNLFIEEELVLDELVDLANVDDRLGDADNIDIFGLYLSELDCNNDYLEECTCCGGCDDEYNPVVDCLDEVIEESLEDILMMECSECIQEIIENAVLKAFKVGFEQGLISVKNSIIEHLKK